MTGLTVSGLVPSIDTTSIINQLMRVEANPQALLQNQLAAVQARAAAYRALNTRFDALRVAAAAVTDPTAWTAIKATSSAASVTASATAGAVPGSLTFTVNQLATNHAVASAATWSATTAAYGKTAVSVSSGGATTSIAVGGAGTLADAVAAINASTTGLAATAVLVAPGQYRLQVTAKNTGAAATFTLDSPGAFNVVTAGTDAQLTVGSGPGAYVVTSATNTFTGLMAATTITVGAAAITATVSVAKDPAPTASKVQTLVDAANGLLSAISAYTDRTSPSAALKGDVTLRSLASQVLGTVSAAVGGNSAAVAGLQLTRDGRLTFDSAVFSAKLTSDPTTAQSILASTQGSAPLGVAAKLQALASTASNATIGTITRLATSQDSRATDLQARIANWDTRLALRRNALTAQFTAMTTALGTLQNQGAWLTAQIAALPSGAQPPKR